MNDIELLLKQLEENKTNQQALVTIENQLKMQLKALLDDTGLNDYKSETYGSIRIQQRAQKYYGESIETMEDELKIVKKLADDLGDYEIKGHKESIVYCLPKDIF